MCFANSNHRTWDTFCRKTYRNIQIDGKLPSKKIAKVVEKKRKKKKRRSRQFDMHRLACQFERHCPENFVDMASWIWKCFLDMVWNKSHTCVYHHHRVNFNGFDEKHMVSWLNQIFDGYFLLEIQKRAIFVQTNFFFARLLQNALCMVFCCFFLATNKRTICSVAWNQMRKTHTHTAWRALGKTEKIPKKN